MRWLRWQCPGLCVQELTAGLKQCEVGKARILNTVKLQGREQAALAVGRQIFYNHPTLRLNCFPRWSVLGVDS